jgi:hypothetical protein
VSKRSSGRSAIAFLAHGDELTRRVRFHFGDLHLVAADAAAEHRGLALVRAEEARPGHRLPEHHADGEEVRAPVQRLRHRLASNASISRVPPALVIEIITSRPRDTKRDRVEKPTEYAHFGIKSFWLVDPAMRTLEIFELGESLPVAEESRLTAVLCRPLVLEVNAFRFRLTVVIARSHVDSTEESISGFDLSAQ